MAILVITVEIDVDSTLVDPWEVGEALCFKDNQGTPIYYNDEPATFVKANWVEN